QLGNAKVDYLYLLFAAPEGLEHDVFRFQIAMKDSAIVRRRESAARLTNDLGSPLKRHTFRFDLRSQSHAVDVLHYQIRLAVRQLAGIKNTHDARMIDACERFLLLLKLLHDP